MSVNRGLLPTNSELSPDLHRNGKICTFADVEICITQKRQNMAKSKSGGTRSYLRGKIGSDVYQNGKDGKGAKQQVVRSLAEVVDNPRSIAQMRSRMCMSSVAQLMRALRPIIDHSFDGVPKGQPSISHFRSLAMQAYMEDAASASPKFGYVGYGEKYVPNGNIVVSQGKADWPKKWSSGIMNQYSSSWRRGGYDLILKWEPAGPGLNYGRDFTLQELLDYIVGGDERNFVTFVAFAGNAETPNEPSSVKMGYCRFKIDLNTLPDVAELSGDHIRQGRGLIVEGNIIPKILVGAGQYSDGEQAALNLEIDWTPLLGSNNNIKATCQTLILSKYVEGKGYIHSTSMLNVTGQMMEDTADKWIDYTLNPWKMSMSEALATYPQGSARFLNGGEI